MNVNMKDFTRIKSRTEKHYFWKNLLIIYVFLAANLTYNSNVYLTVCPFETEWGKLEFLGRY